MTGLTAFGVGIAFGYLLSVFVAVLLTGRGEFPHDTYYDDDPDDPPTLLDGWHGAGPRPVGPPAATRLAPAGRPGYKRPDPRFPLRSGNPPPGAGSTDRSSDGVALFPGADSITTTEGV